MRDTLHTTRQRRGSPEAARHTSRAFTLYELLLVMGITMVLATIGSVNLVNFKKQQDIKVTTEEIIALLRNAQYRSIVQEGNVEWSVHFENPVNDRGYYDLFQGTSYNSSTISARKLLRSGIQFSDPATGGGKDIVFTKLRGEVASQINIKVEITSDPASSSTIVVNTNGKIQ